MASGGTDNSLYRLGDELVVRLPRADWARSQPEREHRWLPHLAPALPIPIPEPVALGEPGAGYPCHWAIHRWLPGRSALDARLERPEAEARRLGEFVLALRAVDARGGPRAGPHNVGRGLPLAHRDGHVRDAVAKLGEDVDGAAVLAAWDRALAAGTWDAPGVWVHGDIHAGNLLVEDGRVRAVIDFGTLGVGDPAVDLLVAWTLFDGPARAAFRETVEADDALWQRGRGWALSMAIIGLPYYRDSNPVFVAQAWRMVEAVLSEPA